MASSKKKVTPVVSSAAAVLPINYGILAAVAAATRAGPTDYVFVSDADREALAAANYIQINPNIRDASGAVATRASDVGLAAIDAYNVAQGSAASGFGAVTPTVQTTAPAAPVAATGKPAFKLVTGIAIPDRKRGSIGPRGETYPFGTMNVGEAFFIAATAEKPNPERSFASSVASATERYAVEVPGQTRVTRTGKTVTVTNKTREFHIARVEDGAPFGDEFKGVAGAGVWRTA